MSDRRCKYRTRATVGLAIFLILWLIIGAMAEETPLNKLAPDIMQAQWRLIVFLVGIVQVLVGFIYIAGITSVKNSIRKLFDLSEKLEKDKLDKEDHDRICKKEGKK